MITRLRYNTRVLITLLILVALLCALVKCDNSNSDDNNNNNNAPTDTNAEEEIDDEDDENQVVRMPVPSKAQNNANNDNNTNGNGNNVNDIVVCSGSDCNERIAAIMNAAPDTDVYQLRELIEKQKAEEEAKRKAEEIRAIQFELEYRAKEKALADKARKERIWRASFFGKIQTFLETQFPPTISMCCIVLFSITTWILIYMLYYEYFIAPAIRQLEQDVAAVKNKAT